MVAPARLLLLLSCLAGHAAGAVIGIDLGSRFLKVGIIQPGTGIELVLNEATQRKSSSTAGFNSQDERVYGNEAQNLLGKLPAKVFVLSKILLGAVLGDEQVGSFAAQYYPYKFEDDAEGHGAVLRYDGNSTYRPEEMVAFVLSYAKQIAEGHAKASIKVRECRRRRQQAAGMQPRSHRSQAKLPRIWPRAATAHHARAFALSFSTALTTLSTPPTLSPPH